ncbi:MAG: thiamine-binding protein [Prevotellaceae bacterium]|jgi:uncharacterized protein YqgV (UPF0045/DUF77 family)|nr:thiamine-binding protein [Prevotellaceae bacterium]
MEKIFGEMEEIFGEMDNKNVYGNKRRIMNNTIVNLALQVLPSSLVKHPYDIVDEAIKVIAQSGLNYKVTPFETVIEGHYDEIMRLVKQVQETCYKVGADSLMTYIKIQSSRRDVTIADKMAKYE